MSTLSQVLRKARRLLFLSNSSSPVCTGVAGVDVVPMRQKFAGALLGRACLAALS
jgi:hypothetical protein